jgi:hypothetical protein
MGGRFCEGGKPGFAEAQAELRLEKLLSLPSWRPCVRDGALTGGIGIGMGDGAGEGAGLPGRRLIGVVRREARTFIAYERRV